MSLTLWSYKTSINVINCKNFSNSQLAIKYTAYGTVYTVHTDYSAKFEKFV